MKQITNFKRVLSGMLSAVMAVSAVPIVSAHADESTEPYPYTLFAASSDEGAITVNAGIGADYMIDNYAGWLGDYLSMLYAMPTEQLTDIDRINEEIGSPAGYFSYPDVLADVDAVNMYSNNKNFHASVAVMFNSYFKIATNNSKRFGSFAKNVMYENLYSIRPPFYYGDDISVYKEQFQFFVENNLDPSSYTLFNGLLNKDNLTKETVAKLLSSSTKVQNTATAFTDYVFSYVTDSGDIVYG